MSAPAHTQAGVNVPPDFGPGVLWHPTARKGLALAPRDRARVVPREVAARAQARAHRNGYPSIIAHVDGEWLQIAPDVAEAGDVRVSADGYQSLVADGGEALTWDTVPHEATQDRCPHGEPEWCASCPCDWRGDRVRFREFHRLDPRGSGEFPPEGVVIGITLTGAMVVDVGYATLTASQDNLDVL